MLENGGFVFSVVISAVEHETEVTLSYNGVFSDEPMRVRILKDSLTFGAGRPVASRGWY